MLRLQRRQRQSLLLGEDGLSLCAPVLSLLEDGIDGEGAHLSRAEVRRRVSALQSGRALLEFGFSSGEAAPAAARTRALVAAWSAED